MDLHYFLDVLKKYPEIPSLSEHIKQNTELFFYLSTVSFDGRKRLCCSGNYIGFRDNDSLISRVIDGTAEILFKYRLSQQFCARFMDIHMFENALRRLSNFLSHMDQSSFGLYFLGKLGTEELDKLNRIAISCWSKISRLFSDDISMALFVFQVLDFAKHEDLNVFRENWSKYDFFEHELEMIFNRAKSRLFRFLEGSKHIDFFPRFGNDLGIPVRGGLMADGKLINFCRHCGEEMVKREALILKACSILGTVEKFKPAFFFVYGFRDGQFLELR